LVRRKKPICSKYGSTTSSSVSRSSPSVAARGTLCTPAAEERGHPLDRDQAVQQEAGFFL
jgi:hypothetical protein